MAEKLRVCAYCRVSTRQEKQEMSLSSQIQHFNTAVVTRNKQIDTCAELLKKYDKMETFDEEVFNQMVEQIVVMNKNRLLYKFKNGYTADIEVIDYYLVRDEIGEVEIYVST